MVSEKAEEFEIPVIDCSSIREGTLEDIQDTEEFQEFTQKLGDTLRRVGFVYFTNHGLRETTVESLLERARELFFLPEDVKAKYKKVDAVASFHGYSGPGDEALSETEEGLRQPKLKTVAEFKESYDICGTEQHDESMYPSEVPQLKESFDAFRAPLLSLAKKILRSFAVYLELEDRDFFIKKHEAFLNCSKTIISQNQMRILYYRPMDEDFVVPENTFRLQEHSDWGTMTFLYQDEVGGLEAKMTNGQWVPVTPIKDSLVLNAGLMLEMWSGGRLLATPHRVRMIQEGSKKARQSIGCFITPDGQTKCVSVVPEQPDWTPMYPRAENETHYEYFQKRVASTRTY